MPHTVRRSLAHDAGTQQLTGEFDALYQEWWATHKNVRDLTRENSNHAQESAGAAGIDQPLMQRFIGRLRFFEYGIVNHCADSIGTSRLEGVNNKIKAIKRNTYGFHDPEYFALKVKQALPGGLLR
jgi:transposase